MAHSDEHLDDLIRQVPVPRTLRAGLAPEAVFSDSAIDRALGAVPVPPKLADRIRTTARAGAVTRPDGVVDLSRFVAAPAPATSPPRPRAAGRLLALAREAGSVAAALGLAAVIATLGIELSRRLEDQPVVASQRIAVEHRPAAGAASDAREVAAGSRTGSARPTQPLAADQDVGPQIVAVPERADLPGAAEQGVRGPAAAAAPGPTTSPMDATVRGAPVWWGDQPGPPTMLTVPLPSSTRRAVPRSTAFDLAFEMAHGESPFVDPASDPVLALDRPALTLRTDGFVELLVGRLGRRPAATGGRLRVEEVLAAMPPPPVVAAGSGAVRLGLHGVRAGRVARGVPTLFLEVAAYAGGDHGSDRPPLEATLIVDQSAAGDVRGWPAICRGLGSLAGLLGPADRLTVVLCGSRPRVALRDAEPSAVMAAASSWEALPAVTGADLDAALELAAAEGLLHRRTVVVAHAVTLDRGQREVRDALANWHRALAAADGGTPASMPAGEPRFIVIDPATPGPAAEGEPTFGRTGLDATAIRRELLRQVTGRETLVARQCHLEVRFDPGRVARYRLVGHRQTAVESLAAGPPPAIDLHAGETVRAVYEIVPRDGATSGLAAATLAWRSPGGGEATLGASHRDADADGGLPSPHGCELLLAVGLGELVSGSPHQPQPRATLATLERLAHDWRARGDVTAFGASLMTLLERSGPDQRPGR